MKSNYSALFNTQLLILFSSIIINLQHANASAAGNETDRLALLKFKQGITSDPFGVLNSWNDSVPFCKWFGITCCPRHHRVAFLVLKSHKLMGFIPPHIGNLSFLKVLDLQNNSFSGQIPPHLGNLFRLQQLFLNNNTMLEGEIPANLSRCLKLRSFILHSNNLSGEIPSELGSLAKLEILALGQNNLTGRIPVSLANLTSLVFFSVQQNNLVGNIPNEFGRQTSLEYFSVAVNHLSGNIPPSLLNISSVKGFSFPVNQLHGTLPENMGLALPNLQGFGASDNNLSGRIPESLSNATQLQILRLGWNQFTGQVSTNLGNLKSLQWLGLGYNHLGNKSTNDWLFLKNCTNLEYLDLNNNNFGGVLPGPIGNLSTQMSRLYLGGNQISGNIPTALENLVNLIWLTLDNNHLTGTIPPFLEKLQKLQGLSFESNCLSGRIPSSIANLTQLFHLNLSDNQLEGSIPIGIFNSKNLQWLDISKNLLNGSIPDKLSELSTLVSVDLSHNLFTGSLPAEIGKLTTLNTLDVSGNRLSGDIPSVLGDCSSLEYLYMQENSFHGSIPSAFASLRGLQKLDLSRNYLTGAIPQNLQTLPFLLYLNLSFNDLEGEIPARGVFRNASGLSLVGNNKLCGGVPQFHLPKCQANMMKRKTYAIKLVVIITCSILFVLLLILFLLFAIRRRKLKKNSSTSPLMKNRPIKVSYWDLYQATNGFSSNCLIGSGSFGAVYKGFLSQTGRIVAIKVLKLEENGASKSFIAECTALRNVRHRNLVKLLTYCSTLDNKRNEFKALIFEFMENGSLEKWLHQANDDNNNETRSLNFLQRLDITINVASAMHYLHDHCKSSIIHCDLKPSNILLDDNMVAHVSDFGLSKLFRTASDASQSQISSTGMKGTIGYAPPEYGLGGVVSKEGDIYSFGILMLELFSGRRPTDETFKNGLNLHIFVRNTVPERLVQIMDPTLAASEETNNYRRLSQMSAKEKECLIAVFRVGIACSNELPKDRMNMGDVAKELHLIKSTLIGVRIYG